MKSITVHNLDDTMDSLIRKQAHQNGVSLNKAIKTLLKKALGLNRIEQYSNIKGYNDLFGIWNEKDLKLFEKNTSDFEKIDQSDWQ